MKRENDTKPAFGAFHILKNRTVWLCCIYQGQVTQTQYMFPVIGGDLPEVTTHSCSPQDQVHEWVQAGVSNASASPVPSWGTIHFVCAFQRDSGHQEKFFLKGKGHPQEAHNTPLHSRATTLWGAPSTPKRFLQCRPMQLDLPPVTGSSANFPLSQLCH